LYAVAHGAPGRGFRRGSPFVLGFLAGLLYFTGTLYWITRVMAVYGGLPFWLAALLNAGLIIYLSVFPALFAMIVRRLISVRGPEAVLAAPFIWVATELARGYLTGFPWAVLGHSQISALPIAQLASIGGVYSLSWLTAGMSAAVVFAATVSRRRFAPLALAFLAILAAAAWGSRRVAAGELTRLGEPIKVGLVQGNVDQAIKWDPRSADAIFQDYIRKTRQAIFEGAELVIWPESSTPFMFEEDPVGAAQLRTLVRQARVSLIFGSDQIEPGSPRKFYNSAFLLRPDGSVGGVYRKIRLVPFGEYVPYQRLLFFAAPLTEQVGSFTPGERAEMLPVDGHRVSVAICYEVIYPSLVRRFVSAGSELLTTITNDAWFGDTSAPAQHFEQAAMRSVEEGRYLVRAANTGISGIVDPYGRVLSQTPIFQPAVVVGQARMLTTTTFFARHGDLVTPVCLVTTLVLLFWPRRRVQ
jgi:apolipoprotein N-acyltransferase